MQISLSVTSSIEIDGEEERTAGVHCFKIEVFNTVKCLKFGFKITFMCAYFKISLNLKYAMNTASNLEFNISVLNAFIVIYRSSLNMNI